MVQFSSFLSGLTKNISNKDGKRRINHGRQATIALAKEARKNGLLLTSHGNVNAKWSSNYACAYFRGGNKGINQDRFIVWEVNYQARVPNPFYYDLWWTLKPKVRSRMIK